MARPHDRKRHGADKPSHQDNSPTNGRKRQRTDECLHQDNHPAVEDDHHWQYPPEFWDRLSKIPLIHSALDELERRSYTRPSYPSTPIEIPQHLTPAATRKLAQFARHGGPDLRHLRGYPPATTSHRPAGAMSSSSRSRATKPTNPTTVPTASGTTTTKRSTAYNRGFEQHLTDYGVHPTWESREPDLEDTKAALSVPRPSLSPSKFSDGAFETFQENNARARDKYDVLADVIPTITGPRQTHHPLSRNTMLSNLEPLTNGTIVPAKPNIYYGAYPQDLDRSIRDELAGRIIPSTMEDRPLAPNLFMEVQGPDDIGAVAIRQARYDGALGARAMHALQNYDKEPKYDGEAYTFSSTYMASSGTLQLYAHHVTAPTTPEGRPEYHMTQMNSYAMTNNRDTFVQGATAFRNARDIAKQHRDNFIQAANARASQAIVAAARPAAMEPHEDEISTLDDPHELHEPVDPAHPIAFQDADSELQQHIAETSFYEFEDDGGAPPVSHHHYVYTEADSQVVSEEPGGPGDDPSMSFASSFTSGFSADQSRSKRSRPSLSPQSKSSGSHVPKSRTRPSAARRTAESSTSAAGSVPSGPSGSHWVGTYWCRGKVCFRNLKGLEVKTELQDWTGQIVDGLECFYWEDSQSGRTFWAMELPQETTEEGSALMVDES